jgi:lipopolysaccharide export system permease protein
MACASAARAESGVIGQAERYVIATLLAGVGMVMLVLLVLGGLVIFIGEQGSIGIGSYGALSALAYAGMNLPRFALDALPVGAMIGAMLGIGNLARSQEITAMRAAGMSKRRLARAALLAGAVIALLALAVGEYLAPRFEQQAEQRRAFAKYDDISIAGRGGAWMRDGDLIINVSNQSSAAEFAGMVVYQFGADRRLRAVGRADRATASGGNRWQLYNYAETRFEAGHALTRREASHSLDSAASSDFLQLAVSLPEQMSLADLRKVVRYRTANELAAGNYEFAWWSRIAGLFALLMAMVFAVPFGFGLMRSAGSGARLTIGLVVGVLYFFLQRIVGTGIEVLDLSLPVVAWLPCAVLGLTATVLLWRAR